MNEAEKNALYDGLRSDETFALLWSDKKWYWAVHALCEEHDEVVKNLLLDRVKVDDWFLKTEALVLIGFHYDLSRNENFMRLLMTLINDNSLIGDNGDEIRETAASVFGVQQDSVDSAMVAALDYINSWWVKRRYLMSLLSIVFRNILRASRMTDLLDNEESSIDSYGFRLIY